MPEGVAGQRATGATSPAPGFEWPEEIPWSELGFVESWGHTEDGKLRAEHWEVEGQSGSGKSYLVATAMQERAQRWGTVIIAIVTKNTDDSMPLLGWPVVSSWAEVRKYRWSTFWPRTTAKGEEREKYHEKAIYELLSNLWPDPGEQANVVIYVDEIRYLESLSRRLKKLVRMYWREGRSHGISIIAGAQRPLEMVRDMHSEARWRAVFCPSDEADMERFAELLGPPRDWEPVLRALDQELHQCVLRNSFTRQVVITWVDTDLHPLPSQVDQKRDNTPTGAPYGPRTKTAA